MASNNIPKPVAEMLSRNKTFAETYKTPVKFSEFAPKARATRAGVVVVSCADPRLNPHEILGLDETLKATQVRNAGGRAFDALRSLAWLGVIGNPGTIVIMHHTDCGTTHATDSQIEAALIENNPAAKDAIKAIEIGSITKPIEETLRDDIKFLRASPLIMKDTRIVGLKYEIETGLLTQVET